MLNTFIIWFLIGIAATFVGITANEGASSAVFIFLCPLGAIIWLPVATAFGLFGMLLGAIFGSRKPKDRPLSDHARTELRTQMARAQAASSRNAALRRYLAQGKKQGLTPQYLFLSLTRNGWNESEVRDALAELPSS